MIQRYLKYLGRFDRRHAKNPYLRALAGLDRHALKDIGISEQEIAMIAPSPGSVVIASGLSARWSLSGDWVS